MPSHTHSPLQLKCSILLQLLGSLYAFLLWLVRLQLCLLCQVCKMWRVTKAMIHFINGKYCNYKEWKKPQTRLTCHTGSTLHHITPLVINAPKHVLLKYSYVWTVFQVVCDWFSHLLNWYYVLPRRSEMHTNTNVTIWLVI